MNQVPDMSYKKPKRPWAMKRRLAYGGGFMGVILIFLSIISFSIFYKEPTCYDRSANGGEAGIDCGGTCVRICAAEVIPLKVLWVEPFRVSENTYNVVAYIENRNLDKGIEKLPYTIRLFDDKGEILNREGITEMPPDVTYPLFEGRIATSERVPTYATIEFGEDPVWVPARQNGERYMTERRELSGADKKPVITAVVKNESREEAQEVDVVATIFNSQGIPLTASRTKVPLFPGGSTKQVTFTWQEPIAKTIRTCEVPSDIAIAIDLSGSMNNDAEEPPEPITSVLRAAKDFALRLNKGDQTALVTFATEAESVSELTPDRSLVGTLIGNLVIKPESEQGSTNTGDGLLNSLRELESARHNEDARRAIVLLTDGLATAPDPDPELYARDAATLAKQKGIELFTIGLGTDLNEAFLKEIATDEEHYFRAPTTQTLGKIYESITSALCEERAAQIQIVAKPQGTYLSL
jgi:Mg-chelatase subunit ChlD